MYHKLLKLTGIFNNHIIDIIGSFIGSPVNWLTYWRCITLSLIRKKPSLNTTRNQIFLCSIIHKTIFRRQKLSSELCKKFGNIYIYNPTINIKLHNIIQNYLEENVIHRLF
jgi:hypothetical protein